jgi:polysaccharide deacetylase family protein (PEP-CTERM system associated)
MLATKHVLLTIDVEEWFQVENLRRVFPPSTWPVRESRVERSTHTLLDLFSEAGPVRATFFVLGRVAGRMPHLVREIHRRGHEVASHGCNHELCTALPPRALGEDLSRSKALLEDLLGAPVHGYRAPSFSVSAHVLETARDCGYRYDSSYNSYGLHGRYGRLDLPENGAGIARRTPSGLVELPVSNLRIAGRTVPLGGGGYFRLAPYPLFLKGVKHVLSTRSACLLYFHPWEVDPGQPRVPGLSRSAAFRHYTNLERTLPRMKRLLHDLQCCTFTTCSDYLAHLTWGRDGTQTHGFHHEEHEGSRIYEG